MHALSLMQLLFASSGFKALDFENYFVRERRLGLRGKRIVVACSTVRVSSFRLLFF